MADFREEIAQTFKNIFRICYNVFFSQVRIPEGLEPMRESEKDR